MNYPPDIDVKKEEKRMLSFLEKSVNESGKTKVVLAASGGIDSSTALMLSTKSLGPEKVISLFLPSRHTDPIHQTHLNQVLDLAEVPPQNRLTIPITAIIQKTWRIIKHYTSNPVTEIRLANQTHLLGEQRKQTAQLNRIRIGNLAARIRMLITFDQAKLHDALVVGTENKSEHLLGYYTRFGDEASDIEPLRHLYKTQLYQLAEYLKVPQEIILKAPTAGLWQSQTDAAELGFSYQTADPILYLYFEKQNSPTSIAKKLSRITRKDYEDELQITKKVIDRCQQFSFKNKLPYSI